ncbi:RNA polymerase I [Lanmaoa asiatica]|nr:RNA polymerase I [Lanmaoa asiatica]
MSSASSNIVFDDIFTINAIDKEGKKFDRGTETRGIVRNILIRLPVSRLYARSKNHDMDMTLDYNVELFPLAEGQSFAMALASSLIPSSGGDGAEAEDRDIWRPDGKGVKGLEEEYDYVMYGKVYKFDGGGEIVTVYASFGGLLLSLTGSFRHMAGIVLGDPVFILLRK